MSTKKKHIALWFRYGPAEHVELCHALPAVIDALSPHCDIHYFGMRSSRDIKNPLADKVTTHYLPLKVNRTSTYDKTVKTLLWYFFIPYMAVRCRILGIHVVYIDETIPLSVMLTRIFFGKKIAIVVADFFVDVYMESNKLLAPLRKLIKCIDYISWRALPVIFTKTKSGKKMLIKKNIPEENIFVVQDPCDTSLYQPIDKVFTREQLGFSSKDFIIVHHGILHPNKGNDMIIRALSEVKDSIPNLCYLLVGSGPEEEHLKELTHELGMESHVTFTGWLPKPSDVNSALNTADIGLVMRIGQESDDFHITGALVHNMACGLPILAARLAGIAEIIEDGKNGFLFDPQSKTEFISKLKQLAEDKHLRERFGASALKASQKEFNINKYTERTVAALLKVLYTE